MPKQNLENESLEEVESYTELLARPIDNQGGNPQKNRVTVPFGKLPVPIAGLRQETVHAEKEKAWPDAPADRTLHIWKIC